MGATAQVSIFPLRILFIDSRDLLQPTRVENPSEDDDQAYRNPAATTATTADHLDVRTSPDDDHQPGRDEPHAE